MRGFSFIPIILLLFSIISSISKKQKKKSEKSSKSVEHQQIEELKKKFGKANKPLAQGEKLNEHPIFGSKEYKEGYDFRKEGVKPSKTASKKSGAKKAAPRNRDGAKTESFPKKVEAKKHGKVDTKKTETFAKETFADRELLKRAFIMKELLDKPVSLRRG